MPFNLQAAMGYAQFQRIDELVGKKQWIFKKYQEHLSDVPDIQLNSEENGVVNGAWVTGLVFGKSHNMCKILAMEKIKELGYPARPFFYPLSSLPAYPGYREKYESKNKNSYDISSRGINLPCDLMLTESQIVEYCDAIKRILRKI
jgi:perosamine synthetase